MLNRQLLSASAVIRSAVATRHVSRVAVAAVPFRANASVTAHRGSHAQPSALRRLSQSASARDAAEATAAAPAPESAGAPQSVDPNAPDFVLPQGYSVKETSQGLKLRPPKDNTFASMKGHMEYDVLKALTVKPFQYTEMSEVQQRVLHLLPDLATGVGADASPMPDGKGRDLLIKAKTGTGKTIAFMVPALEARFRSLENVRKGIFTRPWAEMLQRHRPGLEFEKLDKHGRDALVKQFANNTVGVLILSPTRELATQIANEAKKLLTHSTDFRVQLLVGGADRRRQIEDWRRSRPDVVVATPGRVIDLLNDVGMIKEAMSCCRTLVLDEADTLLEMGFRQDIHSIMNFLPAKVDRQNMLFSATVSREIQDVARASLEQNFRFIDCVPAGEDNVHQHIPQFATVVDSAAEQIPQLLRLIAHDQLIHPGQSKTIVFAPTTKLTQMIAQIVRNSRRHLPAGQGAQVYELHSNKPQSSRFNTSDRFRQDKSGASILVTSDVSARGVDYPGTTRVIQIGVPSKKDQYIHRIGRTGRAGASGRSDIILMEWERGFLHFQLDDLPVKELSLDGFQQEMQELCQRFDQSPDEFKPSVEVLKASKGQKNDRRGESPRLATLQGPLTDRYLTSTLTPLIREGVESLQVDEANDVFTSLLGYYMGRVGDMRATKEGVLEALKAWAVDALGMEHAPYTSPMFLQKLGISPSASGSSYGRSRFDRGSGQGGGRDFAARGSGGRDFGGRGSGGRSFGGRDSGDRSFGGRDSGERTFGGRDSGERSFGGRSFAGRGYGARESTYGGAGSSGRNTKW